MTSQIIPEFPIIPASNASISKRGLVHGVGINDSDYIVNHKVNGNLFRCPVYAAWIHMLTRCYSAKYHAAQPTYRDCTVCNEWLTFSNFRKWMVRQDWQSKHLDKDILVSGNKIYSPETCLFVYQVINNLIQENVARRGKYPRGVCWDKFNHKYLAYITRYGKRRTIGRYDTVGQAERAYGRLRSTYIHEVAAQQIEPLKSALLRYGDRYVHS